ncbi:MAG: squalene synthase HpnC [Solirubrobacteraceae bacterium]
MVYTTTDSTKYSAVLDADSVLAKAPGENFRVASRLLPSAVRADLLAIYGFARLTDDIGDTSSGDRTETLTWLEREVTLATEGRATHPILQRVGETIAAHALPIEPFRDLIEANRQDQRVHRYETFSDLEAYCRLSANPVGRLVLGVLGAATPRRVALSDDVCTGLQVVEHLQDISEDLGRDRVYLPLDDLRREGGTEDSLAADRADASLRRTVATLASRARRLLFSGAPLAASLPWRPRIAVAGFAAGGMAALDAIESADYDVLGTRCRPRPARTAARLALLVLVGGARR